MTRQLVGEPRLDRVAGARAVARAQALARQLARGSSRACGRRAPRSAAGGTGRTRASRLQRSATASVLRHASGISAKTSRHLLRRLDVELLGGEPPAVGIGERGAGLDAEQRLVGARVAGLEVVRVVGARHGRAERPGDAQRLRGDPDLLLEAVRLHLHEVVVAPKTSWYQPATSAALRRRPARAAARPRS